MPQKNKVQHKNQQKKVLVQPIPFTPPVTYLLESNILVCIFAKSHHLSMALLRAHVYYEGQQLKGPLKGVNFPIEIYNKWCESVHELTLEEVCIRNTLQTLGDQPVYLLACLKGDTSTLYHEWAHAQYYTKQSLRSLAQELFNGLPDLLKKHIYQELSMRGYQESVYIDEFQAYLLESPKDFGKKWAGLLKPAHDLLRSSVPRPVLLEENKL